MTNNTKLALLGFAVILFSILMIVFWPLAIIWAINTIAPAMSIPYSFMSWLAVVILQLSTFGGLSATIRSIKR